MGCRMRSLLPVALYCLATRLPCTSQLERAVGPRPFVCACDAIDDCRLTSVAQLPSSSRRWRRCPSTNCAGALLAIFWCALTPRPCTRTLRLKSNCRPALRFTTVLPPHLCCSPRLRRWLHRRRRTASSCSASSPRPRSPASSPPCSRSACSTYGVRSRPRTPFSVAARRVDRRHGDAPQAP